MLSVYVPRGNRLERVAVEAGEPLPDAAVWLDVVRPTAQEDRSVGHLLGIELPTREEMQEIEVSSRLYVENGARFMTATLMCHSDSPTPKSTPVTFILTGHRLATVRYDEPRPFAIVEHKLARNCPPKVAGETVLMDLLDAIIDRAADILERIGAEIDQISHTIFEPDEDAGPPSYNDVLKELGRKGDLTSKVRESLVSVGRLLLFLANESEGLKWPKENSSATPVDATRRAFAHRPRQLHHQQGDLPARCHAGRRQHPAEQHHQDLLGRRGGLDAADPDCLDLRHELQTHAGARLALLLPDRSGGDGDRGGVAVHVFQVEEVVVRSRGAAREGGAQ